MALRFLPYPSEQEPTMITGEIAEYIAELTMLGRSPGTLRLRAYQLRGWAEWLQASGLSIHTATRCHVVAYLSGFSEAETRASNMSAVRGLHGWMLDSGRRADDPTRRLPTVRRDDGDPTPIPDPVLCAALLHATPDEHRMVTLGRFAGLRAAEIAAAHRRYLRGPAGAETIKLKGKGGRWRELPAHPEVAAALRAADGWAFPSPVRPGVPIQAGTVTKRLAALLPEPWTAHSLRHAFATDVYGRTGDIRLVQAWLGHSDPRTTARYIKARQDHATIRALTLVA